VKTLLEKLMEEHPGLNAEVEALKAEQFAKGQQSCANKVEARIKRVLPFMRSDSSYPTAIKDFGCQVLAGQIEFTAFEGAIALYDSQKEQERSMAAMEETTAAGETPAGTGGARRHEEIELENQIKAGRERLGLNI
jgi:hypothetical protein